MSRATATDFKDDTVAGPSIWNSLSDPVRNPNSTEAAFRGILKTSLFAWY